MEFTKCFCDMRLHWIWAMETVPRTLFPANTLNAHPLTLPFAVCRVWHPSVWLNTVSSHAAHRYIEWKESVVRGCVAIEEAIELAMNREFWRKLVHRKHILKFKLSSWLVPRTQRKSVIQKNHFHNHSTNFLTKSPCERNENTTPRVDSQKPECDIDKFDRNENMIFMLNR